MEENPNPKSGSLEADNRPLKSPGIKVDVKTGQYSPLARSLAKVYAEGGHLPELISVMRAAEKAGADMSKVSDLRHHVEQQLKLPPELGGQHLAARKLKQRLEAQKNETGKNLDTKA